MKIKVFFNNSCYICRTEINHYKKICKKNFKWVDITDSDESQRLTSKSYDQLLRRLHIIYNGQVISGAKAFLVIWQNIPKYTILYKIFKLKFFYFFFNIFYESFAYILFLKNKYFFKSK